MISLSLPWPPSALRANSHKHWRSRQTAAKLYKSICLIDLRTQGLGKLAVSKLHLSIVFCAPDKRRRDLDGMVSQAKWAIDAIAEVSGLDDYHYGLTVKRGPVVRGGRLEIHIQEE